MHLPHDPFSPHGAIRTPPVTSSADPAVPVVTLGPDRSGPERDEPEPPDTPDADGDPGDVDVEMLEALAKMTATPPKVRARARRTTK